MISVTLQNLLVLLTKEERVVIEYMQKGIIEILHFQNVKGKAKPYQVKQLLKVIEKYKLLGE